MARYIDADLLMKEFCDFVRPSNNSDFATVPTWNDAVSLVGSAPTADVVERKRGKWETEIRTIRGHKIPFPFCSVCGKYTIYEFIYCPNCGAEMESK